MMSMMQIKYQMEKYKSYVVCWWFKIDTCGSRNIKIVKETQKCYNNECVKIKLVKKET